MDLLLGGRVAVVAGASRGLGLAIGQALAREGARVALVARDASALQAAMQAVRRDGGTAEAFPCDLSDRAAVAALPAEVERRLGPAEVLVANAAAPAAFARWQAQGAAAFEEVVAANLRLVAGPLAAFTPALTACGHGRMLVVGSLAGQLGAVGQAPYAAAKSALTGLVRTLALELGPDGVTVNLVLPGAVDTPRLRAALSETARAIILRRTALGRIASPGEVADVVTFLASASAAAITGATIPVTCGYELNERW